MHPPRPFLARVRDSFAAPRSLFAGFSAAPPWFDVLLVSTLVAAIAVLAAPDEAFLAQVQHAVTRRGAPVEITSSPEAIVRYGRFLSMIGALVGHPLVAFGLAGVLALVFGVLGGGGATYRQYLGVVSHALLIPALGTLLLLAAALLLHRPLPTPAALLFPGLDPAGHLGRFLAGLDPFRLWMLALLGLGVSVLEPRRSWPAATLILLGAYLALEAVLAAS